MLSADLAPPRPHLNQSFECGIDIGMGWSSHTVCGAGEGALKSVRAAAKPSVATKQPKGADRQWNNVHSFRISVRQFG